MGGGMRRGWLAFSPLTLALSPLRGEGAAFDHPNYSFVQRQSYDGAHGVTRPTKMASPETG
jgi:hypothetical protein